MKVSTMLLRDMTRSLPPSPATGSEARNDLISPAPPLRNKYFGLEQHSILPPWHSEGGYPHSWGEDPDQGGLHAPGDGLVHDEDVGGPLVEGVGRPATSRPSTPGRAAADSQTCKRCLMTRPGVFTFTVAFEDATSTL